MAWILAMAGGIVGGLLTAQSVLASADAQRADRRPVAAELLADVTRPMPSPYPDSDNTVPALVRWISSDGVAHQARAEVDAGQRAGAKVVVWTDSRGTLTTPPTTPGQAACEAACGGALFTLGWVGVILGGTRLARGALNRQRMREWTEEWDAVEPMWSKRTR